MSNLKTVLHKYSFDVSTKAGKAGHAALCAALKKMGAKPLGAWADYKEMSKMFELDGLELELEPGHIFDNQWNTAPTPNSETGLRVFDWRVANYPQGSKDHKSGYWLEQRQEMKDIRENTWCCGYCGKQYSEVTGGIILNDSYARGSAFCRACLDSEYLEEDNLHLLRLKQAKFSFPKRAELTEAEKAKLLPKYVHEQTEGKNSRNAAKLAKQRADIERDLKCSTDAAQTEHDGLLWLMDNNVNIDNCIYYKHTGRFCFGWRSPIGESVKSKLLDTLCEFPFDYDIKTEKG